MSDELMAYRRRLDDLSGRIKRLESDLSASGLRQEIAVCTGTSDAVLLWKLAEPPRRWRIVVRVAGKARPLIEAPAGVRIAAEPLLGMLLAAAQRMAISLTQPPSPPGER